MKVQVNLIHSSELRSASMVSVRLYILVAAMVLTLVFVFMCAAAWLERAERVNRLTVLERQWEDAERNLRLVETAMAELEEIRFLHRAVKGWNRSRIPWHAYLEELQKIVPPGIQLRVLRMRATPESRAGGETIQLYHVLMDGYCGEPDAEQQVEALRSALASHPILVQWVERAQVTSFREDMADGARPLDRIFQLELSFYPRSFHEAAAE